MKLDSSYLPDTFSYYNEIAGVYDEILKESSENQQMRLKIATYISGFRDITCIIDFGCGTGLDIGWMLQNKWKVIGCEPSEGMRNIAIDRYKDETSIHFELSALVNFKNWNSGVFQESIDAVLANFGVINSIEDVHKLFEKVAIVLKHGGHFFITLTSAERLIKPSVSTKLRKLIKRKKEIVIKYKEAEMRVFAYTPKDMMTAAKKYFQIKHSAEFKKNGFHFFHFVKV